VAQADADAGRSNFIDAAGTVVADTERQLGGRVVQLDLEWTSALGSVNR
jgi:hypothetical protein